MSIATDNVIVGAFYMWLQMSFAIRGVWKVAPSDLTLNSQVTVVTVSLNYYQCRNFMISLLLTESNDTIALRYCLK